MGLLSLVQLLTCLRVSVNHNFGAMKDDSEDDSVDKIVFSLMLYALNKQFTVMYLMDGAFFYYNC